jgi:hypothetical protein
MIASTDSAMRSSTRSMRAKPEPARVADVEFQHGVPGGLERPRATRERPPDLIANLRKM